MELKPNCGSDRAWVWTSTSDFADGEPKPELLAIRFANSESKYSSAVPYGEITSQFNTGIFRAHTILVHNASACRKGSWEPVHTCSLNKVCGFLHTQSM